MVGISNNQAGPSGKGGREGPPIFCNLWEGSVSVHGNNAAQVTEDMVELAGSPKISSMVVEVHSFRSSFPDFSSSISGFGQNVFASVSSCCSFDPLGVDQLALVLVEEIEEQQQLDEGAFAQDPLDQAGNEAPMLVEGFQAEDLAMVAAEDHPPLNTIHQEHRPLLLQFTIDLPQEVQIEMKFDLVAPGIPVDEKVVMEETDRPDEQNISSLISDSRMDFNILIGVVFQEILAKKNLAK
ncbi:hypothetical protein AMTR_s00064p00202930 [Amborella trichopoda]|uniref:Uncharacterized protein n=1 Tax=Amborella trichopoda TaxID=13333 RepID=U5DBD9_AMBTC|nr:hypothetical protein AMTR_s00064p00202930 [Amborella trichopoda]